MGNEITKSSINILKSPFMFDDFEVIFAVLDVESFENADEFNLMINLLTQHSNPIREAVASRLEDYIQKYEEYFLSSFALNKILDAIIDINPNVCRSMCNIIQKSKKLQVLIEEYLVLRLINLIEELKEFEKANKDNLRDENKKVKSHTKNKKMFSLYWYLEALSFCISDRFTNKITEILQYTIDFSDYTIREKTSKLLVKIKNPPLELLRKAKNDQNFYVKIQVYDKINFDD